jgi:hypothetical protein
VARSATGFEAAVNVGSIKNSKRVTVVLAESFLKLGVVQIQLEAIILFEIARAGTAVVNDCERGNERDENEQRDFSAQRITSNNRFSKPPTGAAPFLIVTNKPLA